MSLMEVTVTIRIHYFLSLFLLLGAACAGTPTQPTIPATATAVAEATAIPAPTATAIRPETRTAPPTLTLTPERDPTAEPVAAPAPFLPQCDRRPFEIERPTQIHPQTGESWTLYSNEEYGFSFLFPPEWTLIEGDNYLCLNYRPKQEIKLIIGYKWFDDQNVSIIRSGVGAGELIAAGEVNILDQEIRRNVLHFEGKDIALLYANAAHIRADNLLFTFSLDDFSAGYDQAELTPEIMERADAVVESFRLIPIPIATDELLTALVWQSVPGVEDYPLQRLTGWANGFQDADYCRYGPYRWLDGEHLLLMPVTGYGEWPEENPSQITQPLVSRLDNGRAWAIGEPEEFCQLPLWSESRQQLIEATAGEVRLRDLAGQIAGTQPGQRPLHLAPSGRRLLAGTTWIDLESEQAVDFPEWPATSYAVPGWTADEQRLFACCFSYADAGSGQSWTRAEFPGMFIGGRGSWPGEETFSRAQWLPGDSLVMLQDLGIIFVRTGQHPAPWIVPLFEPQEERYFDLIQRLDLDTPPVCWSHLAPGGNHLWLECRRQRQDQLWPHDPSYLVTLPTLETVAITGSLQFGSWSADGRFLIYNEAATVGAETGPAWLMGVDGRQRQLAETAVTSSLWREDEAAVALRFPDEHAVQFVHAEREMARRLEMAQPVVALAWQPGNLGLALLTADGRVWWLADPFDATSEPLAVTPPLAEIHSLRWSPDGGKIAFVSENDLYVVTIRGSLQSYRSAALAFSIAIPGAW